MRACGPRQRSAVQLLAAALPLWASGCTGMIEGPADPPGSAITPDGTPFGSDFIAHAVGPSSAGAPAPAAPGDSDSAPATGAACVPQSPPPTTRLARLTHKQYDNTLAALTGLALRPGQEFLADQRQAGFDRGLDLQVGAVLARSYRDAAESAAAAVVADPAAYARVVGCDPAQGDSCAHSFISSFGGRALRRPLTAAEETRYFELFQRGPELVDNGDDFQRGVQLVLEALLQSPKFLYRIELSAEPGASAAALSSYEVASRLSYLLLSAPPDETLMQAAEADRLRDPEAVAAQAARLLSDGQAAHETVRDFHHQWLDLDVYPQKLTKDTTLFPNVTPALAGTLQREVELFVDDVSFQQGRGLTSLFTAPFSFVNRTTAALYGVDGSFDDTLQRVELDPAQRAGLLTQLGFLAAHAFSTVSSPIHRGVFIQRRILCNTIPAPPPNVPALPAVDGTQIRTTRQQVDEHTAPSACAGCHHTLINPVGFGLENYDAVGSFRTQENGVDVDASGMLAGTQANAAFSDGVGLAHAIAQAPETRACYAKNWFRYTLGRAETAADSCAISQLADKLQSDEYSALDLLTDLTRSQAFLYRASEAP